MSFEPPQERQAWQERGGNKKHNHVRMKPRNDNRGSIIYAIMYYRRDLMRHSKNINQGLNIIGNIHLKYVDVRHESECYDRNENVRLLISQTRATIYAYQATF